MTTVARTKKFFISSIFLATFLLVLFVYQLNPYIPQRNWLLFSSFQFSTNCILQNKIFESDFKTERKFIILLWTTYFGSFDKWYNSSTLSRLHCARQNCLVTTDRSCLEYSDAVVFHWRDVNMKDLPEYHKKKQMWILYMMESPINSEKSIAYEFGPLVDWTMSYRLDSDIHTPYGAIVKRNTQDTWKPRVKFRDKRHNIAWIVSHCETQSKRERFVEQLQKYIDVDIYGACGQYKCLPYRDKKCLQMIEKNYKFYLSFENSVSI